MRHPVIAIFSIGLILLAACGREQKATMTESQALDTLSNFPTSSNHALFGKNKNTKVNLEELKRLLIDLVASGKIKLPSHTRGALTTNGQLDLSGLNAFFAALQQNGGKPSVWSLASTMLGAASSGGTSGFNLNSILELLNVAMPFITAIAPQFAGVMQALVVIIPLVINIISMFKKPTPTPSAFLMTTPCLSLHA